ISAATLRSIRAVGRPSPADVTEHWLSANVFFLKPELLAYAYRGKSTPDAVAATLARMANEEKITTEVVGGDLVMHLKVPADTLSGYEADLCRQMFRGMPSTSTSEIRNAYRNTGFDPALVIQPGLKEEVAALNLWPAMDIRAAARDMI